MGWRKRSLVLLVAAFLMVTAVGAHAAEAANTTVVQTRNMLVVQDDGNTVIQTARGHDVFRPHVVSGRDFHPGHAFDRFRHFRHGSLFFTADHLEDVIEHRCDLAQDRLDLQRFILEESVRGDELREEIIDAAFDAKDDRLAFKCDFLLDRF